MRYRRLGKTGFQVSEMGYGAWGIGGQLWLGGDDRESAQALRLASSRV
jgi:aryl-alcohol dehydrogenase-like predicted oxidoreductase